MGRMDARGEAGGRRVHGGQRKQEPLVTVITAVLNGEATLERAIRSVISQTLRVEYIVVDGGSSDGTRSILRGYDHDIDYWISEPDDGIYHALNKGISLANGEWVYFLGADDALASATVISEVFSQRHRTKLLYGNVIHGDASRVYGGEFNKKRMIFENVCQQAIFYRRELFTEIGYFDTKYCLLADWAFNIRAFGTKGVDPHHLDLVVADYSLAGASTTMLDLRFAADRLPLLRRYFGLQYYLRALSWRLMDQLRANFKKYMLGQHREKA